MTDRLRLQVVRTSGGEIYSWTGPGGFLRSVEAVIQSGHLGTGALGAHLGAIFANPLVYFRLLSQNGKNLEFGFRVPIEASSYLFKAGSEWREAGYNGSMAIDPASLELRRLTIDTEELQAETSMCESSTTMNYSPVDYPSGGEGVLLPSTVRTHDVNRDATETEWVTTLSGCREAPEKASERPRPALFPPTWAVPFKLALAAPIDTSTGAAGDVITARLAETIRGLAPNMSAPAGAILTGRIMSMEHRLKRLDYTNPGTRAGILEDRYSFLIWVDFDTIEAKGVVSSIRVRLICGPALNTHHGCQFATMSDQKWDRALVFDSDSADANIVVPAGYTSNWITGEPASKNKTR